MPAKLPIQIVTVTGQAFSLIAAVGDMSVDRLKEGLQNQVPATQEETVGQTITVVSQTGPAGAGGESGVGGASGAGANVTVDFDGAYSTDVTTEDVLDPGRAVQLGNLPSGTLAVVVSARARALGGAVGTFKIRLGGTDGSVDGTVLVTLTATSSSFDLVEGSAVLTNPNGTQLLKLTGQSSVNGLDVAIETVVCSFRPA